jgi:predicted acylesterase/phospholipase RssA
MYHYGVTRCLWEKGILPKVITGSSGGSIVAGLVCSKTDIELEKMYSDPQYGISCKAWDGVEWSIKEIMKNLKNRGSILDPEPLK